MWDSKISLEGSFIQSWMDKMSVDGSEADSKDVVSLAEGLSAEVLVGVGHCFAWQGTRPFFTDELYISQ